MYDTDEYLGSHRFSVKIDGGEAMDGFLSCSSIISTSEPIMFKHGLDPYIRKAPGRVQWEDVTLERVYSGGDDLSAWRKEIVGGTSSRKDVTVTVQNASGETIKEFTLVQAFPVRWELPALNAQSSEPAVERITFCVEAVEDIT